MKFQVLVLALALLTLNACQNGLRKPSSVTSNLNLQSEAENILSDIKNPNKFRLNTCTSYIKNVYQDLLGVSPTRFDVAATRQHWNEIYQTLWKTRVELRQRLTEFSMQVQGTDPELNSCVNAIRDGFRMSRFVEDYLAETFSGEPQDFKAGDPKHVFSDDFKPTPLQGSAPWLMTNPKFERVTIRSGDIIISRGNAYTSSAIARIAQVDSQFSHLAFIYVKGDGKGQEYTVEEAIKNPNVLVLESFIEVGSSIRTFKQYLEDGNARNMMFRYSDALIAHRSAKWSYDYIQNYRRHSFDSNPIDDKDDVNHNVPYNFQMDLANPQNPKKLFCSQIAYVGFYSNNLTLPYFSSTLNTKLSLIKRMSITTRNFFAPGDMEVDPRFELVAEYRNLRKLKGLRMKDMVLTGMNKMMEEGYEIFPPVQISAKSIFAWTARQMDMKFVKDRLPRNMNIKLLNTTFTLEKVAMYFEKELQEEETAFQKVSGGLPMSFGQGLETIERVKVKDREIYMSKKTPKFHFDFRPKDLRPGAGLYPNK